MNDSAMGAMGSEKQMGSDKQRWLKRLARRLQLGLFLKTLVDWSIAFLLGFGGLVLLSKIFWPGAWPNILWLGGLAIPLSLIAYLFSRREPYSERDSVALLDRRIRAGGLLMTIVESPDEQWERQLPQAQAIWRQSLPSWRPWRALKLITLPALFLLVVCFIPPRPNQSIAGASAGASANQVEELKEMLKELEEHRVVDEEDKEKLDREIEKLAEETRDKPLTHENWETVDTLKQKMEQQVANRENQLNQAASAVSAMQRELQTSGSVGADQRAWLENLLAQIGSSGQGGKGAPRGGLNGRSQAKPRPGATRGSGANQSNPGSTQNSQTRVANLPLPNQSARSSLQQKLNQLSQGNKVQLPQDPQRLNQALKDLKKYIEGECNSVGQCRGGSLCQGGSKRMPSGQATQGGKPGRGGVNRGPGPAALTWGQESEDQGVQFKEMLLPQSIPDRDGELLGTQLVEPKANPQAPAGRSEARPGGIERGQAAAKQRLRPRHKEVVKEYFRSGSK